MYEWDEQKRQSNIIKHGLDFVAVRHLFDGRHVIDLPAHSETEPRTLTVGMIDGKFYTVVWTQRGEKRRIISFRRSRDEEKREYQNLYGRAN